MGGRGTGVEHPVPPPGPSRGHPQYLDKNYAGVFIVWDRLVGTLEPQVEQPVYGLPKNIDTYNPRRVAFHEYAAIGRDLAAARGMATRLGILFRPPAWSAAALAAPAPAPVTAA